MSYALFFYAVAALILASSLVVALSGSIIYSAFALLFSFLGVALIYAMLSADFLAVTQLMLYVGGILVLILFAVMLTNRIDASRKSNQSFSIWWALAIVAGIFAGLAAAVSSAPWKIGVGEPVFEPTTAAIGNSLLGPYVLPFEIASVLLLVGLIGAVVVARKESGEK
ncbi:MAG: NADH-quinone oxidoreductase subunit J [Planctomycetes bacterium]|nr:NADH-quinone oxidoreductase subunit J [Planctomycetota bacterium]